MATDPINGSPSSGSTAATSTVDNSINSLSPDQFLKLMITELQNQDPTNPEKNSEIMQQVASISQITSSNKLSTTLNGVALGQSIASAGALIGKTINGLTADGKAVNGVVKSVTVTNSNPILNVGADAVPISNVKDINAT